MIRRHETGFRFLLMLADVVMAVVVIVGTSVARFGADWESPWQAAVPQPWLFVVGYALGWVLALSLNGLYQPRSRWSVRSEAVGVVRAGFLLALITFAVLFLLDLTSVSRLILVVVFALQVAITIATRAGLRFAFEQARRRGRNLRTILVVGTGASAEAFAQRIMERWDLGLTVVGFLGPMTDRERGPEPWLGPVTALPDILHDRVIDEVAICLPSDQRDDIEAVYRIAADEGKTVRIPVEAPIEAVSAGRVEDLSGLPVLSLVRGPDQLVALALKRGIDIVGATVGLIVLSPLFAVVAVAIAARDGRPILFRQLRAGVNGRPFSIVKFRTMARDADARRAELRSQNEIQGGASFKMTDDPRVTPVGRFLRKTSVDELPQLWNVLRGDMSLVGPRPHPFDDVAGYDAWHRRRLSMKPGITGMWQTRGRGEAEFDRWVALDLEYIDHWSLWLDIRLILQTIPAMLRAEGR